MLTKVMLYGAMGQEFGKVWNLAVNTPADALKLINANRPGLFNWVRDQAKVFSHYRVVCDYHDGRKEAVSEDTWGMQRRVKTIKFIPIIQGAGSNPFLRIVIGAALIWFAGPAGGAMFGSGTAASMAMSFGASLIIGGVVQALSPQPVSNTGASLQGSYFNGPSNNIGQGNPVPLIYGVVRCGSQPIHSQMTLC